MNDLTKEWVDKAEGDFVTAIELLNLRFDLTTDAICFHCQQCAEKYAKAYLHQRFVEFPRTHNLAQLLSLCEEQDLDFSLIELEMRTLGNCSVDIRYPGRQTNIEEAELAVQMMNVIRDFIRLRLGL